jgi:hypothetical protein
MSLKFETPSGRRVEVLGLVSWSDQYVNLRIDGVPVVRPLGTLTPLIKEHNLSPSTKAQKENEALSVDDKVAPMSPAEVGAAVAGAVNKSISDSAETDEAIAAIEDAMDDDEESEPKAKPEPKVKAPTTAEVAGQWLKGVMEAEDYVPMTKAELNALALKQNSKRLNTKQIVEAKKIGKLCPANKAGAYVGEGADYSRNGSIRFKLDDEKRYSLA